jgi:hypothetical protein
MDFNSGHLKRQDIRVYQMQYIQFWNRIGLSLVQSYQRKLHKGSLQLASFNIFELIRPLHQEEEFMLEGRNPSSR